MPIQRTLERHLPQNAPLIGQIIRFGVTGVLLTLLVERSYWIVADVFRDNLMLSMTLNYLVLT